MIKTSPIIESGGGEREAVLEAARLMLIAARTAPKSGGVDDVLTLIVCGEEKEDIAEKMEIGEERKIEGFRRDAENVRDSEAVVLIGVRGNKSFGLDCGACGCKSCKEFEEVQKRFDEDLLGQHVLSRL